MLYVVQEDDPTHHAGIHIDTCPFFVNRNSDHPTNRISHTRGPRDEEFRRNLLKIQ